MRAGEKWSWALSISLVALGCPKPSPASSADAGASLVAPVPPKGEAGVFGDAPSTVPSAIPSTGGAAGGAASTGQAAGPAGELAGARQDLNVLVVSIDSLRADMPWAGYPRPIAPRLTELEKRSVSYTRAYAVSSYTSMSVGGMLAGRLPSELKRSGYFFGTYPDQGNLFFPELLQKSSIRTIGAQAHSYFKEGGFHQGFDRWEIVPGIVFKNETDPNVTGPQHEALAEKLLSDPDLDTKRFFAWFHFLDPHDQYLPHDADGIPPFGKTLRDRYDAEVLFTDRQIGKLLDFVDRQTWGKRTVVVVTSDHGEAFGEHGQYAHGFELWENLVRIPLFFHFPGVVARRIDVPRSTIDLAPTVLELFGLAPEPTFEGKSLVSELRGGPAEERDVYLDLPMTSDNDKRRGLVRGHKKLLLFGKEEATRLYDLDADPEEKSPILRGPEVDALSAAYKEKKTTIAEVVPYGCGAGCLNRAYASKK